MCDFELSMWTNRNIGNLGKEQKELTKYLEQLQKEKQKENNIQKINEAEIALDNILKLEEIKWFQRFRTLLLKHIDHNTSFFPP